jgi:hypothetical protein
VGSRCSLTIAVNIARSWWNRRRSSLNHIELNVLNMSKSCRDPEDCSIEGRTKTDRSMLLTLGSVTRDLSLPYIIGHVATAEASYSSSALSVELGEINRRRSRITWSFTCEVAETDEPR